MSMIHCDEIGFTYDGEHFVLDGVSLSIEKGEFVSILGGNGSGKSTFAKHINALLVPDEGTMTVDGADTADEDMVYFIRSSAGMVFQNPDDQLVASLVEDDVAFGPENLGIETEEIATRVHDALSEVGLMNFEKHETHALSGGQKQRVAIAGVLAMKPQVLILDEASSMLDPRGRKGLMRVCKELHAKGMTIVMITHFMEEAAEADRVIVLNRGRIACMGKPEDVLTQTELLTTLNLDIPFACKLSYTLEQKGMSLPLCIQEETLVQEVSARYQGNRIAVPAHAVPVTSADNCEGTAPETKADSTTTAVQPPYREETNTNAESVIEFRDVSYTYTARKKEKKGLFSRPKKTNQPAEKPEWGNDPNDIWAIEHVSFAVHKGEFFGIAGHTGSGKSTLIQHMNGILQPSSGQVIVCNQDVSDKNAATSVRAQIGVVFQYPEHQLFADTVYNDVAFGPKNLGLSEAQIDERVRHALSLVSLDFEEIAQMSPFELSGGQQRRVAFAGVLAMNPEVLVLDEPVAGLDPAARREFLELARYLHKTGLTIVMVSHNMDDLAEYCNRIAFLKQGKLFAVGTPQTVFLHGAELNELGLGLPAPQSVAQALIQEGVPLNPNVLYDCEELACDIAALISASSGDNSPS